MFLLRVKRYITGKLQSALPSEVFWWFVACHLVIWTVVPTVTCRNAPLDVIEGYVWGHEWLMGTYKHPPMQAWMLEILAQLTERAPWTHFLASQVAVAVAFWAVWQTGRRITGEISALTGVLLLEGIAYYNFTTPEFNPNVLQLPFWALCCWSFHRAVRDDHIKDWLLLGLWAAAGIYSKYSTLLLLGSLGLILLTHPDGRRRLNSIGPWCTAVLTTVLVLPHFRWLMGHQFMSLAYAQDRLLQDSHWHYFILYPPLFLLGQILVLSSCGLLFLTLPTGKVATAAKTQTATSFDRHFLNMVVLSPFCAMLLMSAFASVRMRDMWGMPLWNFIGLWAVVHFCPPLRKKSLQRFAVAWILIFIFGVASYIGSVVFGPYVMHRPLRVEFPGRKLSQKVTQIWEDTYHTPLQYVVGDTWIAGNVAYYTPARPHVLIMGDYRISPWVDPKNLKTSGGIIVWCADHCLDHNYAETIPAYLITQFPTAKIQEPLTLLRQTEANVPSVVIGWALLPPAP